MNGSSRRLRPPLSRSAARNCVLINQFATPGLGSLMGGRLIAGAGQLLLATAGFLLFLAWFVLVMVRYYQQITGEPEGRPIAWLALTGVGVFLLSWLWALITSFSLLNEARRNETTHPPTQHLT